MWQLLHYALLKNRMSQGHSHHCSRHQLFLGELPLPLGRSKGGFNELEVHTNFYSFHSHVFTFFYKGNMQEKNSQCDLDLICHGSIFQNETSIILKPVLCISSWYMTLLKIIFLYSPIRIGGTHLWLECLNV